MQVFAIPRVDPGAEGIEILWTWTDTLPLSTHGYDVLRIEGREIKWVPTCETINADVIAILRKQMKIPMSLGPLRLKPNANIKHLPSQPASQVAAVSGSRVALAVATPAPPPIAPVAAVFAASVAGGTSIDEFIQELTTPTDRAT